MKRFTRAFSGDEGRYFNKQLKWVKDHLTTVMTVFPGTVSIVKNAFKGRGARCN
jgi:hypothetical protein